MQLEAEGSNAYKFAPKLSVSLLIIWAVSIVFLFVVQMIGGPLGLSVHPTGEDRVWMDILERPGVEALRFWWALNSRNPLAPWWYELFSPLIHALPSGLYLSRKLLDLFMAMSVGLLISELNRGKRPLFAFVVSCFVLLWNFSGYVEQVMFIMLIAIGFSLLSVYFYVRYLNAMRVGGENLALSLLAFLVALATYSIQCGVPLAVLILGLAYGKTGIPENSSRRPIIHSLIDVGLFVAVFVIFTQIWITTSGPTSSYFKLDPMLLASQLKASLTNLLWHADTSFLLQSLVTNWPLLYSLSLFSVAIIFFLALYSQYSGKRPDYPEKEVGRLSWRHPVILGILISICLVLPTVALETSSTIWYPGSRSRMVQQVFQPIIYIGIIYLLIQKLCAADHRIRAFVLAGSVLCAFGVVVGAEYNRQLVQLSGYEQKLVDGIKAILPGIIRPTHIYVRIDNTDWYGGRKAELNRVLIQQAYGSKQVWLNAIFKGIDDPSRKVVVGPADIGVFSPAIQKYVPYDQTLFLSYDGNNVKRLDVIDSSTFSGYHAVFQGNASYSQNIELLLSKSSCPTRFEFDTPPNGAGWSVPERSASGDSYIWMAAKEASLQLETACKGRLKLSFRTLQAISKEIQDSLRVSAGQARKDIPLTVVSSSDGITEYVGIIPDGLVSGNGSLNMGFVVDQVLVPAGGARNLAVPFDWIRIKQAD